MSYCDVHHPLLLPSHSFQCWINHRGNSISMVYTHVNSEGILSAGILPIAWQKSAPFACETKFTKQSLQPQIEFNGHRNNWSIYQTIIAQYEAGYSRMSLPFFWFQFHAIPNNKQSIERYHSTSKIIQIIGSRQHFNPFSWDNVSISA